MDKNITQLCLENLSRKLRIPVRHGWKIALSSRLKQKKQSVISTWIKRGVPKDFEGMLQNVGIDPNLWRKCVENVGKFAQSDSIEESQEPIGGERIKDLASDSDIWRNKYYELLEKHQTVLEELMKLKEPWSGKERRVANMPPNHDAK